MAYYNGEEGEWKTRKKDGKRFFAPYNSMKLGYRFATINGGSDNLVDRMIRQIADRENSTNEYTSYMRNFIDANSDGDLESDKLRHKYESTPQDMDSLIQQYIKNRREYLDYLRENGLGDDYYTVHEFTMNSGRGFGSVQT